MINKVVSGSIYLFTKYQKQYRSQKLVHIPYYKYHNIYVTLDLLVHVTMH